MSDIQQAIYKKYKKYKRSSKIKNNCTNEFKESKLVLNKTQRFVKKFLNRKQKQKGLLLYHGKGSGKTCAAVAIASGFDKKYQIIWVTDIKLKNEVYKNLFDKVCHSGVSKLDTPLTGTLAQKKEKFKKLTKGNWMSPMSYKQFSNMLKGKNAESKRLYKNNTKDPLHKTLLIIDEAHNLLNPLSKEHDLDLIEKKIYESYEKSGKDSVKILLLSATPLSNNIGNFFRMMNIFQEKKSKRVETDLEELYRNYIKSDMSGLNKKGELLFKNIGKYISYIDILKNKNEFAQPKIIQQNIKFTTSVDFKDLENELKKLKKEQKNISGMCSVKNLNNQMEVFKGPKYDSMPTSLKIMIIHKNFPTIPKKMLNKVFIGINNLKRNCGSLPLKEREACIKKASDDMREVKKELRALSKACNVNSKKYYKKELIRVKEEIVARDQTTAFEYCNISGPVAICRQNVSLWGSNRRIPPALMFDDFTLRRNDWRGDKKFDPVRLRKLIYNKSPKLLKLFKNITKFDTNDQKKYGKKFKHVIYIHNNGERGTKLLIGIMLMKGFDFMIKYVTQVGNNNSSIELKNPMPEGQLNFAVLTSGYLYNNDVSTLVDDIIEKFNERPANVNGENIRFLIFDKNFIKGTNLHDVKYLHVLDPYLFDTEKVDLYGRVLGRCGSKGLKFVPNVGWKLKILSYNSTINGKDVEKQIREARMTRRDSNSTLREIIDTAIQNNAMDKLISQKNKSGKGLTNLEKGTLQQNFIQVLALKR